MSLLDNFTLYELPRNFSLAELRITKTRMSVNQLSASEMHYPACIRVFVSADKTQMAIQPCQPTENGAVRFLPANFNAPSRKRQPKSFKIGNKTLLHFIKSNMNWDENVRLKVVGEYHPEEDILLFDFTRAVPIDQQTTGLVQVTAINPARQFVPVPTRLLQPAGTVEVPFYEDTLFSGAWGDGHDI